jgi:hypothetical protein
MVVVLSSHAVSAGLNYHRIMTGSVLLKSTLIHYVGLSYPLRFM